MLYVARVVCAGQAILCNVICSEQHTARPLQLYSRCYFAQSMAVLSPDSHYRNVCTRKAEELRFIIEHPARWLHECERYL